MPRLIATVLAPLVFAAASASASAGDCDMPLAAAMKLDALPYRLHADGRGEFVAMLDKVYIEVGRTWRVVPRDQFGMADEMRREIEAGNVTCTALPDETAGGVAVAVFAIEDADGGPGPEKLWVARDSGLPIRAALAPGEGDGPGERLVEFSYTDVTPPGVQ